MFKTTPNETAVQTKGCCFESYVVIPVDLVFSNPVLRYELKRLYKYIPYFYMHIYTYLYRSFICEYMQKYIYTCIHTYMHSYICIHTHKYIQP